MAQDQQNAAAKLDGGGATSALHRKTATGRAEHQARAMTLARALRLSIAKVADDVFDMAMATIGLRTQEVAGPDLISLFDDASLLLLLDGPQKRRAGVVIDPVLVGALIQQQTMGRVLPVTDDTPRTMTTTDAAICAPFLDAILERAEVLPETEADRRMVKGYRFGARAEDARLLHLSMDAASYLVIHLEIDVERGSRQGKMMLCMPIIASSRADDDVDAFGLEADKNKQARPVKDLSDTVPALPVELSLVLSRFRMPLNRITALEVGAVLPLGAARFDAVDIRTKEGRKVGTGTLGQLNGQRAVRVAHRPDAQGAPRRREDDRADMDQPPLTALGQTTNRRSSSPEPAGPEPAALPQMAAFDDAASLPDLPDMSDIPDFDDLVLPEAAQW
jgi:flagellar motor switch/type III secretory pathway protein FliN